MSLWDDAAATFRAHLSSEDPMNFVMLVTTVNPKLFGGNMFLNSTPATKDSFSTQKFRPSNSSPKGHSKKYSSHIHYCPLKIFS